MFKIVALATGNVLEDRFSSESEARVRALPYVNQIMGETPHGRRALSWVNGKVNWKVAQLYVRVERMIGEWVYTDNGQYIPDESFEDNEIVFLTGKSDPHMGSFDADDGTFYCIIQDKHFDARMVRAYLVLPEYD